MNFETLLEFLELESADEFEYFENLADLVEADAEILPEAVYQLFEGVEMEILGELLENYFEEMLKSVPEDTVELYTLLDSVKMALIGMSRNIEEDSDLVLLADEFTRFRNWYSLDSVVWVREIGEGGREKGMPLRDALTLSRVEQLGGESYEYIFDEALDFEMDQYSMSFADLAADDLAEEPEDEDEEEDPQLKYTDYVFTPEKLH
ncbi:hypothetical protein NE619_04560 [Anaerovorax odorimutans]|uniref:Uncharacterized protein n=1 Tax=Anaerovorax odorimutans TaxID=109327 RepID=A0ABT1RLC8_9FIRM|nr:hypothetical protein [Anaerovorax odorimutans]MCQ4635989.1 hypothetical protein [Anaerovorax odorimutans]